MSHRLALGGSNGPYSFHDGDDKPNNNEPLPVVLRDLQPARKK